MANPRAYGRRSALLMQVLERHAGRLRPGAVGRLHDAWRVELMALGEEYFVAEVARRLAPPECRWYLLPGVE